MRISLLHIVLLFNLPFISFSQTIKDDFEGNGTIKSWQGDDCSIIVNQANPYKQGINLSATVLEYKDIGGQYANVRFDINNNLDLSVYSIFSFKLYVPSDNLTGNQPNRVSLKLQDGKLGQPWSTQTEINKPVILNQWQIITIDFANDTYINFDNGSLPPKQRMDLNRVLIQINGENNSDKVLAYIDDFSYIANSPVIPIYDKLVWSDEFDKTGAINSNKWYHQTELPIAGSWYNGEVQHYTNRLDNCIVNSGILKIIAKKETYTDQGYTKQYTSARLNSKFAFKYGRVEVRAKLPSGIGTWPAIWMLGKNIDEKGAYWDNLGFGNSPWPACGEIDIMEHWGSNQNYVQSAVHSPSSFGNTFNLGGQTIQTASTEFHLYTLEWTSEKLVFSVDSMIHYSYNPIVKDATTWPFNSEQYLLINLAILPSIGSGFSQSALEIDYVRIYQENSTCIAKMVNTNKPFYFPNPVYDQLTVDLGKTTELNIPVKLLSIDGKLLNTGFCQVNSNTISISNLGNLSNGIYIISYVLNNISYSFKFIKI